MLINLQSLVENYDITLTEVLHVGAHLGEEAADYYECGDPRVYWVEANPAVLDKLDAVISHYPRQAVIPGLVTDKDLDYRTFHVTNYDGMSSSVFPFADHPKYSPDTVFVDHVTLPTITIDTIVEAYNAHPTFLNLDIQGAELLALQGATKTLPQLQWIYTEVSTGNVYEGGAQMHEVDAWLEDFDRVETDLGMHGGTHGDAFYVRKHV